MLNYANQKTYPIGRNFSLAQLNVRGLFHKLDQIRLLLHQHNFLYSVYVKLSLITPSLIHY